MLSRTEIFVRHRIKCSKAKFTQFYKRIFPKHNIIKTIPILSFIFIKLYGIIYRKLEILFRTGSIFFRVIMKPLTKDAVVTEIQNSKLIKGKAMRALTQQIEKIIKDSDGVWGIVLEDLQTKEKWTYNEQEQFPAASIIKLPIMVAAFQAAEDKIIRLSDTYQLLQDDLVGGSGVLQHMTPGTNMTINDLITLMIIQSDNTATNILIDLLNINYIQETMRRMEMNQSACYNKLMIVPVNRIGTNHLTARDVSHLLKQLAQGALVSEHACEQMIEIMKKQQIKDGFRGKLPSPQETNIVGAIPKWQLANKTGNITKVRHDVGIFYVGNRQLIATALSKNMNDFTAKTYLMEVGESIYQYLQKV